MGKIVVGKSDLATISPKLAAQWDYEKNELTPQDVTAGSGKKVWWICEKGHSWQARIASRVNGRGCPYCAGKFPVVGETDLATTHSDIASQWDYEKNELTPQDVTAGSGRKVWWICEKGHRWKTSIANRFRSKGCPYCAGKLPIVGETDLATTHPDLATQWDYEKNELTPQDVTAGSGKKVWWICKKGHRWKASIANRVNGNGCPYCARKLPIVGETDLATTHPNLAAQWDYEKNELTPQDVTAGSHKKVWWKCEKGHSWRTAVNHRTAGSGCPYCAGERPIIGKTDLATTHPDLAKQWDYEKNELTPQNVMAGSNKKVWWICEKRHRWQTTVSQRSCGSGCPYCTGKLPIVGETDLATTHPDLAAQWDYEKNELTPQDVTAGSHKKVWWICEKGHRWKASIVSRGQGNGCPYCAGRFPIVGETDLATTHPGLAAQWDYEKNELTPQDVTAGSDKKVWWICEKGHKWKASISSRVAGKGCPYCAGRLPIVGETDLATTYPDLAAQWDYEKNELTPQDVTAGSNKKVWWICEKGHSWQTTVSNRSCGNGCPYCTGRYRVERTKLKFI